MMATSETLPEPIRTLLDRKPDALRAVVASDDDGVEPLYFRDDVEADADPDRLERKAGILSSVVDAGGERTPFGAYRAGVRAYDDVVVAHFHVDGGGDDGGRSVVVSADSQGFDPTNDVITLLFGSE